VLPDFADTGGTVCNTCGSFADGFATLEWSSGRSFADVLADVADALGMEPKTNGSGRTTTKTTAPTVHPATKKDTEAAAKGRERLVKTWRAATKDTGGRVAEYLRSRGLSGTVPPVLRLHPALGYYSDDDPPKKLGTYPAMVAKVQDAAGLSVALHRTYLDPDGPGKADVPKPKKAQGPTAAAAVRLAEPVDVLAVTEGIETGIAVLEATGTPTYAALSAGGLEDVQVPPRVKRVELWADRDETATGQKAAAEAAARLWSEGREVVVLLPPQVGRDWLDVFTSDGAEALKCAQVAAVPWQPAPADTWEWEQPLRLDTPAGLPPFPVQVLPPVLRDFVSEVAESRQVPADMPALAVLGVLATCTAGRYRVDLPTHSEPCNLYLLCGVEPGTRKSQTMRDVSAPLHEAEALMVEQARQSVDEARAARDVAEQRAKQLQTKAAKLDDPLESKVVQAELAELLGSMADPVALPRLTFDDATPERVAQLLAENRGTLAMLSAEGGIVGMMAGRYSDRPNLDCYLKAHAGDPLRVDRASGRTLHLPHPALTLCLMVQPQILRELADVQGGRGRGLLGRFLYSLPVPNLGSRAYRSRAIDRQAASRYGALVAAMLAQPLEDDPRALSLRGGALDVWVDFYSMVEERQREGGDLRPLADWASKAAGAAARIAGCLHAAEHAHDRPERAPIAPETVAAAVAIADYFVHHALAAFGLMGDSKEMALARRVSGWLDRHRPQVFSLRDLHQHVRTDSPSDLLPALRLLEERAIVRPLPTPRNPAGGRPSQRFAVNPNLAKPSQNSQYLPDALGSVSFVNESVELKNEEPEPFATTTAADGSRLVAL